MKMAIANASFGRRGLADDMPSRSGSPCLESPIQLQLHPNGEIFRIERTWWDAARALMLVLIGATIFKIDSPDIILVVASILMMGGGLLMIFDHLFGKPRLVVDGEGFHSECLLLTRTMRWEDIHTFEVTTAYWRMMVNAKSLKVEGSTSNTYVHVPNVAFKLSSLAFVRELLKRRPDMTEAILDVMKRLGAKKQIQQLLLLDKSVGVSPGSHDQIDWLR
ncbi:MAG: hypothetical protein ACR2PZ_21670 [Pseudomonadales bacterium]